MVGLLQVLYQRPGRPGTKTATQLYKIAGLQQQRNYPAPLRCSFLLHGVGMSWTVAGARNGLKKVANPELRTPQSNQYIWMRRHRTTLDADGLIGLQA